MPMLDIYLTANSKMRGFSLIELTVVLVLISLATALVLPNLSRGYDSLVIRSELDELLLEISSMGFDSFERGKSLNIETAEDLNSLTGLAVNVEITEPLKFTSTGVCLGGEFVLFSGEARKNIRLLPPFCEAEVDLNAP